MMSPQKDTGAPSDPRGGRCLMANRPAHVRMHSQLTGNAAHPPMTTFTVSVAAAECQSRYVSSDKVPAL